MHVLEAAVFANLRHHRPRTAAAARSNQPPAVARPLLPLITAIAAVGLFAASMEASSTRAGVLAAICDRTTGHC